jgi:hypothetical protein
LNFKTLPPSVKTYITSNEFEQESSIYSQSVIRLQSINFGTEKQSGVKPGGGIGGLNKASNYGNFDLTSY